MINNLNFLKNFPKVGGTKFWPQKPRYREVRVIERFYCIVLEKIVWSPSSNPHELDTIRYLFQEHNHKRAMADANHKGKRNSKQYTRSFLEMKENTYSAARRHLWLASVDHVI